MFFGEILAIASLILRRTEIDQVVNPMCSSCMPIFAATSGSSRESSLSAAKIAASTSSRMYAALDTT